MCSLYISGSLALLPPFPYLYAHLLSIYHLAHYYYCSQFLYLATLIRSRKFSSAHNSRVRISGNSHVNTRKCSSCGTSPSRIYLAISRMHHRIIDSSSRSYMHIFAVAIGSREAPRHSHGIRFNCGQTVAHRHTYSHRIHLQNGKVAPVG